MGPVEEDFGPRGDIRVVLDDDRVAEKLRARFPMVPTLYILDAQGRMRLRREYWDAPDWAQEMALAGTCLREANTRRVAEAR